MENEKEQRKATGKEMEMKKVGEGEKVSKKDRTGVCVWLF